MTGGSNDNALINLRITQIEREMDDLRKKLDNRQDELEYIESLKEDRETEQEEILQQAADTLEYWQLTEDSNPVHFWADRAEMDVEAFLTEMRGRIDE